MTDLNVIIERLNNIEKRLASLESHRKFESKLNEIHYRELQEDLDNEPPEHRAAVEKRVAKIMKELND
jgi:hypothetical protein